MSKETRVIPFGFMDRIETFKFSISIYVDSLNSIEDKHLFRVEGDVRRSKLVNNLVNDLFNNKHCKKEIFSKFEKECR